jgi:hypothetical protein
MPAQTCLTGFHRSPLQRPMARGCEGDAQGAIFYRYICTYPSRIAICGIYHGYVHRCYITPIHEGLLPPQARAWRPCPYYCLWITSPDRAMHPSRPPRMNQLCRKSSRLSHDSFMSLQIQCAIRHPGLLPPTFRPHTKFPTNATFSG